MTRIARWKPLGIAAFIVAVLIAIAALGQLWITRSEPYELARALLGDKLGVAPHTIGLDRFAGFKFSDGPDSGHARFVLCGASGKCFFVFAQKLEGRWAIADLIER
ncbi:hypothetical protein [Caenimonas sedimenti]|uniref:hypothetical protein n=1 Tax=Caenimonas sedimenti TaxID=2596921 RepID=UPI00164928B2|nr:hypothetical protein [Caenimonas sedimenti]